jgi:hypothetical protein
VRNGKIHVELLGKFGNSEEFDRSNLKVDRSNFAQSRSIKISQNLLLQKRARTPNQELLHDKKQSPFDFRSRTRWLHDLGCL